MQQYNLIQCEEEAKHMLEHKSLYTTKDEQAFSLSSHPWPLSTTPVHQGSTPHSEPADEPSAGGQRGFAPECSLLWDKNDMSR